MICIAGPTAVGKTGLSIRLAQDLNTDVLSFDSRQFYKEMLIGTAKPTPKEMQGVPHHCIGHLSVHDYYNVSMFEQDALKVMDHVFERSNYIVAVGGSGLYLDALCKGIDDLPDPNPEIRERLKQLLNEEGIEALQEKLKELDPAYYDIVDLKNPKRLLRALEVCEMTGETFTSQRTNQVKKRPFNIVKVCLNRDRQELYSNINKRVDIMVEEGLIDEAKGLLQYRDLNALNTVGYKELFEHFDGKCSLEQALENIKTNTRRYAKRQVTWFKRDPEFQWFNPDDYETIKAAIL